MGKYQQEFTPVQLLMRTTAQNLISTRPQRKLINLGVRSKPIIDCKVCLLTYPPSYNSGYLCSTIFSNLSVAQSESLGLGVVLMGTTNGRSLAIPRYGNEQQTFANQSRDDVLPNPQSNEQSLSEPKDAEQQAGLEVIGQYRHILRNIQVQQQGNDLVVTGLRDIPPPAYSNLQKSNDNQHIDLGYKSTEKIAAQIEGESYNNKSNNKKLTD
jgi:hypothetical protein